MFSVCVDFTDLFLAVHLLEENSPWLGALSDLATWDAHMGEAWSVAQAYSNVLGQSVYLFFLPVMLPSVLPRLGTDSAVRMFPGRLFSF